MIKSIKEILEQIVGYPYLNENATEIQKDDYKLLQDWGNSIVHECEITFHTDNQDDADDVEGMNDLYHYISPKSIERVKNVII